MLLLIAFGIVLLVNSTLIGWGWFLAATRATVELSEPVLESRSNALCPGETLDYRFVIGVSKAAHIELKTSERGMDPEARNRYVRLQELKFVESTTLEMVRHWNVPSQYVEPLTGQEVPWEPGRYEQITVANVVGRSEIAEIRVAFSIRDNCRGN